jgi:hypothetical protein
VTLSESIALADVFLRRQCLDDSASRRAHLQGFLTTLKLHCADSG